MSLIERLGALLPDELVRRIPLLAAACVVASAALTAVIGGQIADRRIEVEMARGLGPEIAMAWRDAVAATERGARPSLPKTETLAFLWRLPDVPLDSDWRGEERLQQISENGPVARLIARQGNLRGSYLSLDGMADSLDLRLAALAGGLARQDRDAMMVLQLPDQSWLYVRSPLWRDRVSEAEMLLYLIGTLFALGAAGSSLGFHMARPFRRLARRDFRLRSLPSREAVRIADIMQSEHAARQEALDERTRMLAAMSHDLRTPATRLGLRAEYIEDEPLRDKILADIADMTAMINAALDFLQRDARGEEPQLLSLAALVEAICDDYADTGRNVLFTHQAAPVVQQTRTIFGGGGDASLTRPPLGRANVLARPIGLRRTFSNLIDNALNYGGEARVMLQTRGDEVLVEITDKGPGIPEEEIANVFKPFYRLEKSRNRQTGGSGLGLAIAKGVIDSHGGRIELINQAWGGLIVRVILPRGLAD